MKKNNSVIKIHKNVLEKLKKIDGSSNENKINKIMDSVEPIMDFVRYNDELVSVKLTSQTVERLDSFRITPTESRSNILTRLLLAYDKIGKSGGESWAFFKITSRVNKKISLEGQIEYYSKDIIFNSNGDVYGYNVPDTYIVNGEDLTDEYNIFLKQLNIMEIMRKVLEHFGENTTLTYQEYVLEIKS